MDSITLKNLQGLDPNSVTGADLLSIASEFQANLKYDQGAAVGNAFKLQKANAQRNAELRQFDIQQKTNEAVLQQQQTLKERFVSLQEQDYQLAANDKSPDDPQRQKIDAEQKLIRRQLNDLKSLPSASSDSAPSTPASTITDQNISSSDTTQATQASASATALDQNALKDAFGDVLKNPKLPAAMQMDNVIDLLRQRLAREFAVMYDDLSRQSDKYDFYLAQFDIGLIPGRGGKKQHPRVQIAFSGGQAVAYDLFPAGSAYNTTTGLAKTSRIGITGVAQTLFGFGLSAAYSHSRNQYRSSLTQTLYVSAFGAGTSQFGWTFGPSPFEDFVSSGNRAVYALLLVPKDKDKNKSTGMLKMSISSCWLKQGRSRSSDCSTAGPEVTFNLPDAIDPMNPSQELIAVSYQPYNQRNLPPAQLVPTPNPAQPASNTVQLVFNNPVDPNMTVTVNDKILRRVRDVRGRALYAPANDSAVVLAGNQAERDALNKSRFGILESDTLGDDTWFQVNSTTVLLNISRQTAGTDVFPIIRVSDPRSGGRDVFEMASDKKNNAKTLIGEWNFTPMKLDEVRTAFTPLFTEPYDPGRIKAYVDKLSPTKDYPGRIRIISETRRSGRKSPVWLHEQAQVVLETEDKDSPDWALSCFQDEGTLLCNLPKDREYVTLAQKRETRLKVWVDQPPYYDRPGLWADTDIDRVSEKWQEQDYAVTDWADINETCSPDKCGETLWNEWAASIKLKLSPDKEYCIEGLPRGESKAASKPAGIVKNTITNLSKCPDTAITVERAGDFLTLHIPFASLPNVLDTIRIRPSDCSECGSIVLPELKSRLLPGPLVLNKLKEGEYRLEGEHLKLVSAVRLIREGKLHNFIASAGINNVDFSIGKLDPGIYSVILLLNQLAVPAACEDAKKKLQPLTLEVAKASEPEKPATPSIPRVGEDSEKGQAVTPARTGTHTRTEKLSKAPAKKGTPAAGHKEETNK